MRALFLLVLLVACLPIRAQENPEREDLRKRRMELTDKAMQGGVTAAYLLGRHYQLEHAYDLALSWYKKSAEKGHSEALWEYATLELSGFAGEPDYESALWAYRQLTVQGSTTAWKFVGDLYANRNAPFFDELKAYYFYQQGARFNDSVAMLKAGDLLMQGIRDQDPDFDQAFVLFREAAERGNVLAMRRLATMYQYGMGTELNMSQAWSWYDKAARNGDAESMYRLGAALMTGEGLAKDENLGRQYLEEAANRGHLKSIKLLNPELPEVIPSPPEEKPKEVTGQTGLLQKIRILNQEDNGDKETKEKKQATGEEPEPLY